MSTRLFNGSVLNFNSSAVGLLTGIALRIAGQWIDVTEPADLVALYELTPQPSIEMSLRFKGNHTMVNGATGTLSITFSDGFVISLDYPDGSTGNNPVGTGGTLNWQVGNSDHSGDWNAPWQSSIEARPTITGYSGG